MTNMRNDDRLAAAITFIAMLLAVGCGGAEPGTRPGDLSAAEHMRASRTAEAAADHHEAQYDPASIDMVPVSSGAVARSPEGVGAERLENPTEAHHDAAATLHEHAEEHAAAAQALRSFEATECRSVPPETRSACPLMTDVTGVAEIESGVRVSFAPGVAVDALLQRMRCHFAYARARSAEGMADCPLYIHGIDVRAGAGGTIDLVGSTPETVRVVRSQMRLQMVVSAR